MNIPEMRIMPDREETLASVRLGEISPTMAEKWIGESEFEPLPRFPNTAAFDPMQEQMWTLPMAAAWFIWHSPEAVRDQWLRYRRAWLDHVDPSDQAALADVSLNHLFGWADLRRFHVRPYRAYGSSSKEPLPKSNPHCSPRSRFQTALESEKINLIGNYFKDHIRRPIKTPRLKDQIEYLFRRRKLSGPRPMGPFYLVPDKPGTPEFTDLLVYRDEVLGADEVASQADFDEPHWTLEHVLGWIAHKNPRRFRPIAPFDPGLSSEQSAWTMTYTFDFVDHDPEESLRGAILQGQLDMKLDRRSLPKRFPNQIPANWWPDGAITEVPRMWFRRDQVLNLWPPGIHSASIATAETAAPRTPKLKAYSELPRMQEAIINIARDLWKDRKDIPPRVGERDDQIRAEYSARGLSKGVPNERTIRRAFQGIANSDEWEPWTRAGSIS
jgi:hypothetical protein